jgi:hypothetical protein
VLVGTVEDPEYALFIFLNRFGDVDSSARLLGLGREPACNCLQTWYKQVSKVTL